MKNNSIDLNTVVVNQSVIGIILLMGGYFRQLIVLALVAVCFKGDQKVQLLFYKGIYQHYNDNNF